VLFTSFSFQLARICHCLKQTVTLSTCLYRWQSLNKANLYANKRSDQSPSWPFYHWLKVLKCCSVTATFEPVGETLIKQAFKRKLLRTPSSTLCCPKCFCLVCRWNPNMWTLLLHNSCQWNCLLCCGYWIVLTTECKVEILEHDHSNENYWALHSGDTVDYGLQFTLWMKCWCWSIEMKAIAR